ncbi:hypothetical protein [Mycobacterium kyorinense]|uniref:ATPase n=1 Tax=Mycobacterium kyorinense TaxID=487514 RepID=A0A1X1XSA3_9MYCO|nr:hypothetical protein [Mycobacterium kyorinense]ORW01725.1 hypothetical protein AWC14_07880 [Mycobacterium kyorinense]
MSRRAAVLAAVLMTVTSAPAAAATTVPAAAWISANRLPLDDSQHWPDLAGIAEAPGDNAFQVETLCRVGAPDKRLVDAGGVDAARARVDKGLDAWSLQQQIVHYPGDTWRMGQTADQLFTSLQNTATNCGSTAPGAQVTVTTPRSHCPSMQRGGCSEMAAVLDVPLTQTSAHVYLASVGSSVAELAVWSTGSPGVAWAAPSDADVFSAMNPQLCTVWEC